MSNLNLKLNTILKDEKLVKALKHALTPRSKISDPIKRSKTENKVNDSKENQRKPQVRLSTHNRSIPIPNLEKGNFLDTYIFVLRSVISSEVFSTEYFESCLQQVYKLYLHLIRNHGVTQGTKK